MKTEAMCEQSSRRSDFSTISSLEDLLHRKVLLEHDIMLAERELHREWISMQHHYRMVSGVVNGARRFFVAWRAKESLLQLGCRLLRQWWSNYNGSQQNPDMDFE